MAESVGGGSGSPPGVRDILFDELRVTSLGVILPPPGNPGGGGGGGGSGGGGGGGGTNHPSDVDPIPPGYIQYWKASDVYNNKNEMTMKWLVCDMGARVYDVADGSGYRAIGLDEGDYERGWWSNNRSNSSGVFGPVEFVEAMWATPRLVNKFQLNNMWGYAPMGDVRLEYFDSSRNVFLEIAYVNFSSAVTEEDYVWSKTLTEPLLISGLRATVLSSSRPNDYARLSEFNAYYIEDVSEDIVSISGNTSVEQYESNLPIPYTAAGTIDIKFQNIDGKYNVFNPGTGKFIGANTRFEVQIGQQDPTLGMLYTKVGEVWSDNWHNDSSSLVASMQGRNFSKFLQDDSTYWGKVWKDAKPHEIIIELLLMNGVPYRFIETTTDGPTINAVYLKEQSPWSLFGEIALLDLAAFRFDEDNHFVYRDNQTTNGLTHTFRGDVDVISEEITSQLYANKVTVKVNPVVEEKNTLTALWSAPSPTILSWSKLGSAVIASDTTIPVAAALRQSSANLTTNNWSDNGYFFFAQIDYEYRGGKQVPVVNNGEVVRYKSRTDGAFTDCERGALYTAAQDWPAGTYIGEVAYFKANFSNAPATEVHFPFITAIDTLLEEPSEVTRQAHVMLWEHNKYSAKLAVANIAEYYTWLAGDGQTMRDIDDTGHDAPVPFATAIPGITLMNDGKQQEQETIDNPSAAVANLVRRYGKNEITIDSKWIQTVEVAQDIIDYFVDKFGNVKRVFSITTIPVYGLHVFDEIKVYDTELFDAIDGYIIGIDYTYGDGWTATYTIMEMNEVITL